MGSRLYTMYSITIIWKFSKIHAGSDDKLWIQFALPYPAPQLSEAQVMLPTQRVGSVSILGVWWSRGLTDGPVYLFSTEEVRIIEVLSLHSDITGSRIVLYLHVRILSSNSTVFWSCVLVISCWHILCMKDQEGWKIFAAILGWQLFLNCSRRGFWASTCMRGCTFWFYIHSAANHLERSVVYMQWAKHWCKHTVL